MIDDSTKTKPDMIGFMKASKMPIFLFLYNFYYFFILFLFEFHYLNNLKLIFN